MVNHCFLFNLIGKEKELLKMEKWEYKAVTDLKEIGQTIINNAEKMIGGYKYQTGDIDIHITLSDDELPKIEVIQRLLADNPRKSF